MSKQNQERRTLARFMENDQADTAHRRASGKTMYTDDPELTPGEYISLSRNRMGLSQEALEWESGVSKSQISRIERGLSVPGFDTVIKLEQALHICLIERYADQWRKEQGGV